MEDLMRVVGSQEANIGGTSNSTATEVSVSEASRQTALGSNVDDLDGFLSELCRSCGQLLLIMMDPETAKRMAGPGAMWPTMSSMEVSEELLLTIEAGSSGRPNKASDIANFERLAPTLIQIPGIDPTWLAKEAIRRMDDSLDLTEAVRATLPSIVAMNSQKNLAPGGDPNAAGAMQPGMPTGNAGGMASEVSAPNMAGGMPQTVPNAI